VDKFDGISRLRTVLLSRRSPIPLKDSLHAPVVFDADAGGGLLEEHFGALAKRLDKLTKHQRLNLGCAAQRLRFPALAARSAGEAFNPAASATFERRKLRTPYHARSTNELTERTVSPQRIVHTLEACPVPR
jgi:hypothetical protein